MSEALLFDGVKEREPNTSAQFGGVTFSVQHDGPRLAHQLDTVRDYMLSHGDWRTLNEVSEALGFPPASVSARLRDLRKKNFGGYRVERRRRGEPKAGLFEYRVSQ